MLPDPTLINKLGVAPGIPPWPSNLPPAESKDGGVFLPTPLDDAILYRLLYLERYPELCQDTIDAVNESWKNRDRVDTDEVKNNELPDWLVRTLVAVGVSAGAFAGFEIGRHYH